MLLDRIKKKKFFEITIKLKKKNLLNFSYNLNLKNKKHIINKININSKRDILNQMLFDVLNNNVNFKKNNIKALFILKTLHRIKKKAKQIDQKN